MVSGLLALAWVDSALHGACHPNEGPLRVAEMGDPDAAPRAARF